MVAAAVAATATAARGPVRHADHPEHGGGVDEGGEQLLVSLARDVHQNPQRPDRTQHRHQVVDGDGDEDDPGGPGGQVLDEDEGDQGAGEDEVGLLQLQRGFPVNGCDARAAEVPQQEEQGEDVDGDVVHLEQVEQVEEGDEEENDEGGQQHPAVQDLVALELVEQHQQDGHDQHHAYDDESIDHRLPEPQAGVADLLVEGRVEEVGAVAALREGRHGENRGCHQQHADGHGDDQLQSHLSAEAQDLVGMIEAGLELLVWCLGCSRWGVVSWRGREEGRVVVLLLCVRWLYLTPFTPVSASSLCTGFSLCCMLHHTEYIK